MKTLQTKLRPSHPLFSIVTVCFNSGDTIGRTLKSVADQSCNLYEHLVIDGKSTDNTLEVVQQLATPRTKIVSEPDNGIYDAMNKGLAMAKGDYVIFLNAGDSFHSPDVLRRYADVIIANDYPGIVYGQTVLVDNEGSYLGPRHLQAPRQLTLDSFRNGMVVCHQAFCALRRLTLFYNPKWRYSSDYEWCIYVLQHSRRNVYVGDEPVIDYLAEGVTTANRFASLRERFRIMCRYYGTVPTILKHISFIPRFLKSKK